MRIHPTYETAEKVEMMNDFIASSEFKKNYSQNVDLSRLPNGKFTVEFIASHINEADEIVDEINKNIFCDGKPLYYDLSDLLNKKYQKKK